MDTRPEQPRETENSKGRPGPSVSFGLETGEFDSSMSIVGTIYGIALVLGFGEIANGLYVFVFEKVSFSIFTPGGTLARPEPLVVPFTLSALLVVTLGLRFFWGVENIRRYAAHRIEAEQPLALFDLTLSLAVLLFQAFAIYFLARLHTEFVNAMVIGLRAYGFAAIATALLCANAVWLRALSRGRPEGREHFWMRNNALFAALGLASLALFATFRADGYLVLTGISLLYLLNSARDFHHTGSLYFGIRHSDATASDEEGQVRSD